MPRVSSIDLPAADDTDRDDAVVFVRVSACQPVRIGF